MNELLIKIYHWKQHWEESFCFSLIWQAENSGNKLSLILSSRRTVSYRNQSIDWFLYDNGLRLKRVKKKLLPNNLSLNFSNEGLVRIRYWPNIYRLLHLFWQNFISRAMYLECKVVTFWVISSTMPEWSLLLWLVC